MFSKVNKHSNHRVAPKQVSPKSAAGNVATISQQAPLDTVIQRAQINPALLSSDEVLMLQRTIGNQVVNRLFARTSLRSEITNAPSLVIQRMKKYESFLEGREYEIVIDQSRDKFIGRGIGSLSDVGIAIGRQGEATLSNEHESLMALASKVPIYWSEPELIPFRGGWAPAYAMKWIEGPHSKVDKSSFHNALKDAKQPTLESLARIRGDIEKHGGIRDLQVMLEVSTGMVYVVDPRGLGGGKDACLMWVNKWERIATGQEQVKEVSSDERKFD